MPLNIDPDLPPDIQILIKAAYHLCKKADPIYSNDLNNPNPIGYRVPRRELDRVRSKVNALAERGGRDEES